MQIFLIFCSLSVIFCVVHSSHFVPTIDDMKSFCVANQRKLHDSRKSGNDDYKNRVFPHIGLNEVPEISRIHKRSVKRDLECSQKSSYQRKKFTPTPVRSGRRSLLILMDVMSMNSNEWFHLRNQIRTVIGMLTQEPNHPIYDYIFLQTLINQLEPPIISEDPEEFLKKLEENYLFNLGLICPMNTLPNIVSALDYTLPDPHVYVITDAIANDYALEAGVIAAAKKKNATISFIMTGVCNVTQSQGNEIFERIAIATNGDVYDFAAPGDEYSESTKNIGDTTEINDNESSVESSKPFESSTVEIESMESTEATETEQNDATYKPITEINAVNSKPHVRIEIIGTKPTESTESTELDDAKNKSKTTFSVVVPKQQVHINILGSEASKT